MTARIGSASPTSLVLLDPRTGTSWALTGLVATTLQAGAELWNDLLLARSALGSVVLNMAETQRARRL